MYKRHTRHLPSFNPVKNRSGCNRGDGIYSSDRSYMNVVAKKSGMQALACGQGCPVTPATGWSGTTRAWGEEVGLLERVSKLYRSTVLTLC